MACFSNVHYSSTWQCLFVPEQSTENGQGTGKEEKAFGELEVPFKNLSVLQCELKAENLPRKRFSLET